MLSTVELVQRAQEARHCALTGDYETAKCYMDACLTAIAHIRQHNTNNNNNNSNEDSSVFVPTDAQLLQVI